MATQSEIARHLFISQSRVAQLIEKGVLPDAERGDHNIDECREAFIRHLQEIASGDDKALASERTRLAREQADAMALSNAVKRNELLPRAEIVSGWQAVEEHVYSLFDPLPARLAPQIAKVVKPSKVREILTIAIHSALSQIARTRAVPHNQSSG